MLATSRICDYDGLYYCERCHWGDLEQIPARVLHNWDFDLRPVSRRSLQIISYIKRKPVLFNILEFNTMLYGLVDELNLIKRLRIELSQMVKYVKICRQNSKLKINLTSYLFDEMQCDSYAFRELTSTEDLRNQLTDLHGQLNLHITKECEVS